MGTEGHVTWKIKRGDIFHDEHGEVKVIAKADGYIMARRKGCVPFCNSEREFNRRFAKLQIYVEPLKSKP